MRRDLEQAKRLELGLVKVRWLLIAYALVQTMVERVDPNAPSYAFELGMVLTLGMLLSNLFFTQFVQQARRLSDIRWVGAVAFLLDTVVILEWVWVAAAKPSDPAWVMAYLLPIEGAMRYGLLGAFAPLPGPAHLGDRPGDVPGRGVPELSLRGPRGRVPRGHGRRHRAGRGRVRELAPQGVRTRHRSDARGRGSGAVERRKRLGERPRRDATCRRSTRRSWPASPRRTRPRGSRRSPRRSDGRWSATPSGCCCSRPAREAWRSWSPRACTATPATAAAPVSSRGASRSRRDRSWHGRACVRTRPRRWCRCGPARPSSASCTSAATNRDPSTGSASCRSDASPTRSHWSCRPHGCAPARRRCSSGCGSSTSSSPTSSPSRATSSEPPSRPSAGSWTRCGDVTRSSRSKRCRSTSRSSTRRPTG